MIINLTSHDVTILDPKSREMLLRVRPSGTVVRVSSSFTQEGSHDGVPLYKDSSSRDPILPAEREGVIYVVPRPVRLACPTRLDLYYPFKVIRDRDTDEVLGCEGLAT